MIGYRFLIYLLFLSTVASCQPQAAKDGGEKATKDENSSTITIKEKYTLPRELDEISGIAFLANDNNIVYAVQDEAGLVYSYDLKNGTIASHFEFGPDADYEEIATDGTYFYVLESNGNIFSFPVGMDIDQAKVNKFDSKNIGKGEYESLAYDPKTQSLTMLCKSCQIDQGKPTLTGYRLNIDQLGELSLADQFTIDLTAAKKVDSKGIKSLKPSAMSKNNSDDRWYIISSIDNLLLILDENYAPIEILRFKKGQFAQPEGISFNQQDQMYISSERNKKKNAFIYQIQK